VHTVTFHPERSGKVFEVVVIDDVASLLWAAQIGGIELHPYLGTVDALDHPSIAVFDLDPRSPAGLLEAARVAQLLREVLDDAGLRSFPKSSGRRGIHVVIPLDAMDTFATTKPFARTVARALAREHPELVTDMMTKHDRHGKVFVDWSQNDAGKSTVAPYSLRGLEVPTASTPLRWDEIDAAVDDGDARQLWHTADEVLERVEAFGDLHADVLTIRQRLPVE